MNLMKIDNTDIVNFDFVDKIDVKQVNDKYNVVVMIKGLEQIITTKETKSEAYEYLDELYTQLKIDSNKDYFIKADSHTIRISSITDIFVYKQASYQYDVYVTTGGQNILIKSFNNDYSAEEYKQKFIKTYLGREVDLIK